MSTGFDDDPPERDPTDAERALLVRESWWFLLALLAFLLILRTA